MFQQAQKSNVCFNFETTLKIEASFNGTTFKFKEFPPHAMKFICLELEAHGLKFYVICKQLQFLRN